MPRVAAFRIPQIGDLFRQLRFAPRARRLSQMTAAETLLDDLEPQRLYPGEFVVYRITGYRPDHNESVTFPGEALLSDLATMVQRLSETLELPADHEGRHAIALEEAAGRLNVSTRTIRRYRRLGLACHYVVFDDGVKRLACFEDALSSFSQRHQGRVDRAAAFSRMSEEVERDIIAHARRLHDEQHCSLNQTARTLGRRFGRAQETIRALLRRHDAEAAVDRRIFREHGPLTDRDAQLIERAWRLGVSTRQLAEHFGKTKVSVRRALHRRQFQRLCDLPLQWISLPTFARSDAGSIIPAAPDLQSNLDDLLPAADAITLIAAARQRPPEGEHVEHSLVAGYNFLKRRARIRLEAEIGPWPGATVIDETLTDLRWATRLKRRLITLALPHAFSRIQQNLPRPVETLPADRIVTLTELAREVAGEVVENLDPSRQTLSRVTAYAMERALARTAMPPMHQRRAAARHPPGSIHLEAFYEGLTAWEDQSELRRDLIPLVDRLEECAARLVQRHFGLTGQRPRTCGELAEEMGERRSIVARRLRDAVTSLLSVARQLRWR